MCSIYVALTHYILIKVNITSRFSLTIEYVGPMLSLAASTSNVYMLDACISKLSVDIDRTLSMNGIWENLSEEQLINLLTRPELETRDGEVNLRIICCWVDGGRANNQLQERLVRFKQLLELVDLTSITETSFLRFLRSDYAVLESRPHQLVSYSILL